MKKNNISILVLFVACLITSSCSKNEADEVTCTGDNYTIPVTRFLSKLTTTKPGYLPLITNHEYTYNEFNLLEQKNEYTFDDARDRTFDYGCNNNLNTTTNTSGSLNYAYQYDADNRLVAYKTTNSSLHDYTLSYNENTITITGVINSKANSSISLETNVNGLVTKVTRENGYSIFIYDTNDNLIKVIDFDANSGVPIKEFKISYDANPNPFYGQLESAYLERFINYFSISAFQGIDVFFRFDQFNFPYLRNNPILLEFTSCSECYTNILERTYEYDALNYPINMEESHVGAPAIIYEFEYN